MSTSTAIACPDWCVIPTTEHAAELDSWDGHVIHKSDDRTRGDVKVTLNLSSSTLPDGSPSPGEVPHVWIDDLPDALTLDEAVTVARWLIDLVEEVRA